MHPHLRDRILRKLETLGDDRAYQILDYAEFLESKYVAPTAPAPSILERFTGGVEDTLRAGRVSATAVAETMSLLNKAMGVLGGVAEAGKNAASSAVGVVQGVAAAGKSVASELRTPTRPNDAAAPEPAARLDELPPPVPPKPGDAEPG